MDCESDRITKLNTKRPTQRNQAVLRFYDSAILQQTAVLRFYDSAILQQTAILQF